MRYVILYFILFYALIGCEGDNGKKVKYLKKEERPMYLINLPDTISSGIPIIFEVKLIYPTNVKKGDFFSHLILSDSVDVTIENIMKKKDNPYDIMEIDTNHWKVRRTFYKKGNFIVKGGVYVSIMEFKYPKNDSIKVYEKEDIVKIERRIYVK